VNLSLKDLPDEFKGLRIIQISDIHSGSFDDPDAVKEGVDAIMNEKPDLILFTGDLVNDRAIEIEPYLNVFNQLKAPMGVFSVLGNHDYGDYFRWPSEEDKKLNLEQLKKHHAEMGWRLLVNEHVILERNQKQIALIGIENWGARGFTKYGDMKKAVAGLENSNVPVKILLSHDPSHWKAEVRKDYRDIALTLSGHTHGMQFGIDIPGFKWSPVQYVYKQWAGLYQEENQYLYVNRGFGFIGYQGRLGVLPEITMIVLG
jgi:predicted MPP superfamily phosphohydrolase